MTDKELMEITTRYPYSFQQVKKLWAVAGDDALEGLLDALVKVEGISGRGDCIYVLTEYLTGWRLADEKNNFILCHNAQQ
jgi:hypothetical protein